MNDYYINECKRSLINLNSNNSTSFCIMLNLVSLENLKRLVRNHDANGGGSFSSSHRYWGGRGHQPYPLTPHHYIEQKKIFLR